MGPRNTRASKPVGENPPSSPQPSRVSKKSTPKKSGSDGLVRSRGTLNGQREDGDTARWVWFRKFQELARGPTKGRPKKPVVFVSIFFLLTMSKELLTCRTEWISILSCGTERFRANCPHF